MSHTGTPSVVQLVHVMTGRYVTVKPNMAAEGERSAYRVTMEDDVVSNAWFVVEPFYKLRG